MSAIRIPHVGWFDETNHEDSGDGKDNKDREDSEDSEDSGLRIPPSGWFDDKSQRPQRPQRLGFQTDRVKVGWVREETNDSDDTFES